MATLTVEKGLSEDVIHTLSAHKNEPKWMLDMRLKAFNHFINQPTPKWGNTELLEAINFEDICYFNVVGKNEDDNQYNPNTSAHLFYSDVIECF